MRRSAGIAIRIVLAVGTVQAENPDKAATNENGWKGALQPCPLGEAIARKYPEPVVLVTSIGTNGRPNILTVGWTMFCSAEPPMVAIAIGKTRHSHSLILETREFVLAFPGEDLEPAVVLCGTRSGRDTDKFKETGLTARPASRVRPPLIEECLANFECTVEHIYDSGSHTIFVGRIVAAWRLEGGGERKRLFNLGRRKFGGLP